MLVIKQQLRQFRLTQTAVAAAAGISEGAVAQIVNHGIWPKQQTDDIRNRIAGFLSGQGIDTRHSFEPVHTSATAVPEKEEDNMLLAKQVLSPATKKHFGIFRDPFADEALRGTEDIFTTQDIRYVREALWQTACHGGFIAVVGESGAGKTTLRRDLADRISRDNAPVIVIEPYVIAMEDNDTRGKTLKAASIAEAIINTLAPLESLKCSQEARYRQLHRVLKESARAGFSHILVIEEAHSLPVPTLKHLKRFFELEDGFRKLLSVVLIGQPELKLKLSERNQEVREVVQRCEVVELPSLDNHLDTFLDFKFSRAGKPVTGVMDSSAIDAIRLRLSSHNHRGNVSLLYPLAIGNLVIAAMNLAAQIGVPVVNADVIRIV